MKEELPRQAGIDKINEILDDIIKQIQDLKSGTMDSLEDEIDNIDAKKRSFLRAMEESGNKFLEDGHYSNLYSTEYNFNLDNSEH